MAISYSWDVSIVDTYPTHNSQSDVVYNVHWRLLATDDTNKQTIDEVEVNITATSYGTQSIDTSDLSSFKAFADLTPNDVQGWVEAAMGEERVQEIKDNLDAEIAEKVTPTSVTKTIGE
tara:strand:+ start:10225 stop:10581 length:357 start_codon:yes stop_codon:yes gene_type:complete